MGHALNKLLKDFVVRYKAMRGHRVKLRPGWDCHGLPIELKALRSVASGDGDNGDGGVWDRGRDPISVRQLARTFAEDAMRRQESAFRSWSLLADWDQPYRTSEPSYEASQLRLFWKLYERGLVHRAYKPVHWSPSTRTALAEAELEYNDEHKSTAVYVRFRMVNFPVERFGKLSPGSGSGFHPVYAVCWTTTPWTLPLNNAICSGREVHYSLLAPEKLLKKGYQLKNSTWLLTESAYVLAEPFERAISMLLPSKQRGN